MIREIDLPDPSLVVLIGAAGAGKSTFAARHFAPDEILSSDRFRAMVSGDEADQSVTHAAFTRLHEELERRLAGGLLTVVDATSVEPRSRRALLARAAAASVPVVAIVLDLDPSVVLARNAARTGRVVPEDAVRRQLEHLARAVAPGVLENEGFTAVHRIRTADELDRVVIRRHG